MSKDTNKFVEASRQDLLLLVRKKNNIEYLPWATAWAEFKKVYPDGTYEIEEDENHNMFFGNANTGYTVHTSVTANEQTHKMWLPVMDFRNKAILKPQVTDINKSLMRCLTKNLAMFGTGIYLYAGTEYYDQEVMAEKNNGIDDIINLMIQLSKVNKKEDGMAIIMEHGGVKGDPRNMKDIEEIFEAKDRLEILLSETKKSKDNKSNK